MKHQRKKPGSSLRDKIASILALSHRTVATEHSLTATTADVYYIDERSPKFKLRIAIECKDWEKSLDSSDISRIDNLYRPSLNNGEISHLWIISKHELGQRPSETIAKLDKVEFSTYDEFLFNVMNFSLLLEDNIAAFDNHDSSKNFLEINAQVGNNRTSMEQLTRSWLHSKENVLLIYGGYGLGKTSFSLHLASALSKEYQLGKSERIPIRIALGGLYTKQDLRGLVCSLLSGSEGGPIVANFNYNLFIKLVHEGLFLIILDGFDEMRHAMTANEFSFTFEQMSPLFEGDSKTIILGRPDSFFSSEEEERILSELLDKVDANIQSLSRAEISPLSREQIKSYISKIATKGSSKIQNAKRVSEFEDSEIDILSRPVQLSMYVKIIRRHSRIDHKLTRQLLYKEFIYEFVKRENSKPARNIEIGEHVIGYTDPRSIFMQNVAWWVLVEKRENRFTAAEIPHDLIPEQLVTQGKMVGSLREALIGSVIEKLSGATEAVSSKGGAAYYFPHKSYLEFLAAEYFIRNTFTREMFAKFFRFSNKEILSFIMEGPPEGINNIKLGLDFVRGPTLRDFFRAASLHPEYKETKELEHVRNLTAPGVFILYESLLSSSFNDEEIDKYVIELFKTSTNLPKFYASLQIAAELANKHYRPALIESLTAFAFNSLDERHLRELCNSTENHRYTIIREDAAAIRTVFISNCTSTRDGRMFVNLRRIWTLLNEISRNHFSVSDFEINQDGYVEYSFDIKTSLYLSDTAKSLLSERASAQMPIAIRGQLERLFSYGP